MPSGVPHERNEQTAEQVRKMASMGLSKEQMAHIVGMSRHTLEKHYQDDYEAGKAHGIMRVAARLQTMAENGDPPAATFFYLKTQARWRETDHPDEGKQQDPKPLAIE